MSLEDFQSLDNESIDTSIMKGDFLKNYHQQAAILSDCDQKIQFIIGENDNHHQNGNAHLQNEMTIEKVLLMKVTEFLDTLMLLE